MKRMHASQKADTHDWTEILVLEPGAAAPKGLLPDLVNGERSLVVLRGWLPETCRANTVKDLEDRRDDLRTKEYVNGALTTLGVYLAGCLADPGEYFQASAAFRALAPESSFAVQQLVYRKVAEVLELDRLKTAREARSGDVYAPFILRFHSDGVSNPLHNDFMPRDSADLDLAVRKVEFQLSCVVCLQECSSGGRLHLYDKTWQDEDEVHKIPNGLGYKHSVIAGANDCVFQPTTGDIYIFNPKFYHEIDKVEGLTRITLGFFFGSTNKEDRHAIVWS